MMPLLATLLLALAAPPSWSDDDPTAAALIAAHNKERAERMLPPLTAEPRLTAAAKAHAVDMAIDEMATEFIAEFQRQFDIDSRAGLPIAEVRLVERLTRSFDHEAVCLFLDYGETTAGTGDRGTDGNRLHVMPGANHKAPVARLAAGGNRNNLADIGNNTCKHGPYLGVPSPAFHRVATDDSGRNQREPGREIQAVERHWANRRAAVGSHDQTGTVVGDPIDETGLQKGRGYSPAAFDQHARQPQITEGFGGSGDINAAINETLAFLPDIEKLSSNERREMIARYTTVLEGNFIHRSFFVRSPQKWP